MSEKHTLTVVINVFDDKYCDVYFFTSEHKKWCADLMNNKTFQSFVKESMHYPLFNTKYDNPEKDLKSLVRTYLNSNFGRVHNMSIHSYLDFLQSYSLEPAFDIDDCVMDEVYVCDYRIGNIYSFPKLYRADEFVCDGDRTFHLVQENLDDVISTAIRCGDEIETFSELSLYAVKDDRDIEVCPIYGCCKFNEDSNVEALNLKKEDDYNKEDNSTQCCADKDKIDTINKRYDAFRADNFNFTVDDVEVLSSYCTDVFVSYQKGRIIVKAKFYFNKATRNVSTSNAFNIGSKHKLYISVFNDLNEHEELLSLATCVLTKKSYCLNKKGINDPLEEELTFEAE